MAKLKEITLFLDKYLENERFSGDDSWNGLQVEGKNEIKRVAFAVTAGLDVFKKAKKNKADMLVAHHGIFWKKANPSLTGWYKKRVSFLLDNDISFYASHLPLDAHPECGNNAQLAKIIGGKIKDSFAYHKGESIGWIAECNSTPLEEIVKKLEKEISANCIVLNRGKKKIRRVAIVSGGAPHDVFEAIEKDVNLFITGDPSDILEVVKDAKINVIFAGHYATEITGVKALREVIKEKFDVETLFINMPTNL